YFSRDRARTSAAVLGRLARGTSLNAAQNEMTTIAGRLAAQYPDTNRDRGGLIRPFRDFVTGDPRGPLFVLVSAVAFVLLIACANIANLSLSRSLARKKEFALRAALGATRARLIRQLLTETLTLSVAGGAAGLMLGVWGTELLTAHSPGGLPPGVKATIDLTVLLTTLGVSVFSGIAFGIAPAIRFSRPDVQDALKEGGRTFGHGSASSKLRSALVMVQVALALVLLICSGLMTRSFMNLLWVPPGFDSERLLTMEYRVPRSKYSTGDQQWNFHRQVVDRVRSLLGVESATAVLALPYSGNGGTSRFVALDRPQPQAGAEPEAQRNTADQYYFDTMRIPLLSGRVFD